MRTKTIHDVEAFAVGEWNGRSFNGDDLDEMVRAFRDLNLANRLPIKLGHEAPDTAPAQGWIGNLRREGDKLLATLTQVPSELVDEIREGRWRYVSIELLSDVIADGQSYRWVPSALAILGSARPAVDVLRPLHELIARALPPGITFRERTTYSNHGGRNTMSETDTLKAEVKRLNGQLIKNAFDTAIMEKRILPRDREAFERRMGEDATLEEAQLWIAGTPRPNAFGRDKHSSRGHDSLADTRLEVDTPDAEVVALAQAEVERSGGQIDYFTAQRKVLRANPDLAERYRWQPGTRE